MAKPKAVSGKTSKSTAISLRLNTKTKFALDFVARMDKNSTARVIEDALERYLDNPDVWNRAKSRDYFEREIWNPQPWGRLINIAKHFPLELSELEEKLLSIIFADKTYWIDGESREFGERLNKETFAKIDMEALADAWEDLYIHTQANLSE